MIAVWLVVTVERSGLIWLGKMLRLGMKEEVDLRTEGRKGLRLFNSCGKTSPLQHLLTVVEPTVYEIDLHSCNIYYTTMFSERAIKESEWIGHCEGNQLG